MTDKMPDVITAAGLHSYGLRDKGRSERLRVGDFPSASSAAAQSVPAADEPRTLMTDDEAKSWAWTTLKADLEPRNWTVGERASFYGFFNWGWVYRAQYEKQKPQQPVPVVGEVAAYGVPNSRPTERHQLMQVMLELPANAQYPELLVPLIVQPTHSISAAELERIREYIAEGIESDGPLEHDHSIEARKLVTIIDAAIAAEGEK